MAEVRVFRGWDEWGAADVELRTLLPGEVVDQSALAFLAADRWHEGQTRPGGEPYHQHLLQVVEALARGLGVGDVDLLRAGLLHDVVEDTGGTRAELVARFGARTAELVDAVTIPEVGVGESKDSVRTAYFAKLAQAPRDVLLLKLSDRYSNVQRLHTHPRVAKQRSYYAETVERIVPVLHDSVEDTSCTLGQLTDLGVPPPVVEMVDALTRRPGEDHDAYLDRLIRTPAAVPVKRADIEHNSSPARRSRLDPETQERLRKKYAHALEVLGT